MSFLRTNPQSTEQLEQRVRALEQELAFSRAMLSTMANSAYNALIIANDAREILAMNDAARALFQREPRPSETLDSFIGQPDLTAMVEDALANREDVFEMQIKLDDRFFRVRVQFIERGDNTFVGLALEDVTDLVRLNRARRDMVANISHELRTPIANIRLIIDGLFHETEKPKRKKSISSLHAIALETDALLWMADELLDLSMIESGQAIIRMVEEPVYLMVEQAVERVYDQSAAKELDVVCAAPEDLLVLCDHDKIRRVLVNLAHNAVKWSPPGETITIHARQENDEVVINVVDHGPGVPEDQTERIFERFYQADASRSVSDGTGLGLAICKHIVEAHGGRIWAESNAQHSGGRFFFTLPAAEPKPVQTDI